MAALDFPTLSVTTGDFETMLDGIREAWSINVSLDMKPATRAGAQAARRVQYFLGEFINAGAVHRTDPALLQFATDAAVTTAMNFCYAAGNNAGVVRARCYKLCMLAA